MTKARTLADNFAADINGITAGTGITGGGTSGTVTVTNSMATAIDAKGDLVVGTGADTFSRLAVASTAGYLLTVDSGETTGLKWAAAASGGSNKGAVQTTTRQTTSSTSYTALATATEVTVTTGTKAVVLFGCTVDNTSGQAGYASIAVSGASSIAAADTNSVIVENTPSTSIFGAIYFTTLTAGSNTFAMQFRVNTGTQGFQRRTITVIDLGS